MSKATEIIEQIDLVMEKIKDPGEEKATKQVSDLQKFLFDYVGGKKEYKKYKK